MSSESKSVDSVRQTVIRASAQTSISCFENVLGALACLKRASSEINVKAQADMMVRREMLMEAVGTGPDHYHSTSKSTVTASNYLRGQGWET